MGVVGLAENKANSAPIELELELGLSLAKGGGGPDFRVFFPNGGGGGKKIMFFFLLFVTFLFRWLPLGCQLIKILMFESFSFFKAGR